MCLNQNFLGSTVMRSTVINTSKEMTAYSDYPPPADDPNYMHNRSKFFFIVNVVLIRVFRASQVLARLRRPSWSNQAHSSQSPS